MALSEEAASRSQERLSATWLSEEAASRSQERLSATWLFEEAASRSQERLSATWPPKALLIDLDNTILDDDSSVVPCWRDACLLAVSHMDPEALLAAVHKTRDWYWADAARHKAGRADLRAASARIVEMALEACGCTTPKGLARRIGDAYRDGREAAIAPFPGAIETLAELQKRNILLALITNGDAVVQRTKIDRFKLSGYFGHILIEGEFGFGKPEPEVYLAAMKALGAEPAGTWCVGDNLEWEVAAPQALGLRAVWHDFAGRGLPAGSTVKPDYVINRLSDLLNL